MRHPSRRLVITSIFAFLVGLPVSWAVMIWLDAQFRFYGYGFFLTMAVLVAVLIVFVLDGPLNLMAFDWPTPEEEENIEGDHFRHFVVVGMLILLVGTITGVWLNSLELFPKAATVESYSLDNLMSLHFIIIGFLFAFVMVFMLYSAIVFRRKEGDTSDGDYIHGHTGLEIVWTVVPLVFVIYIAYLGHISFNEITSPKPKEMKIEVSAYQWGWAFSYPEAGDKKSPVMYLPLGRSIVLEMEAQDVIHSFWVPEFRVKQDLVPGRKTHLRFTPNVKGAYKVLCAEMCGNGHANMRGAVEVVSPEDFEAWTQGKTIGANADSPEAQAASLAQQCRACHSLDGSQSVGPTWLDLFGMEEMLADGSTITVDEEYLRNSIINPNDQIVSGFTANVMPPNYGEVLDEAQIDLLVDYIISLSE